jgi:hypothetical protein
MKEPSEVVVAWQPRVLSEPAAAFARDVVGRADPPSAARARSLLWACSQLASFGIGVGLEPRPEVLLHPSVIERFVVVGLAGVPAARRRSVRTNLRFVARRVSPALWPPEPVPLERQRAKQLYTPAEIAAFLGLADAQPTEARRHRLGGLVCAGAGAGLGGADLRHVRGSHVSARHGGMVVAVVGGPAPRVVPVLPRYHERLAAAAAFAADGYLVGGRLPDRHNVTNRLIVTVAGGADLPRIELGRLRATWLGACAQALGLGAFFAAAGIACSQHLGDVVGALGAPSEAEAVRLLGGGG